MSRLFRKAVFAPYNSDCVNGRCQVVSTYAASHHDVSEQQSGCAYGFQHNRAADDGYAFHECSIGDEHHKAGECVWQSLCSECGINHIHSTAFDSK